MNYCDTHFHLDLHQDLLIADKIEHSEIYTIAVTNTPSVFFYTDKIAMGKKYLRAALGLHPQLAIERQQELSLFKDLLVKTRYVGEIGLDNKYGNDFGVQREVFDKIISWCGETGGKILTVHSRRAEREVIDIIGNNYPCKTILHWYSGNIKELERAIDYGFYFSVNMAMINSENGKKIIQAIPNDRILTETDAPFVAKVDSPLFIHETVSKLAILKPSVSSQLLFQNFKNLLGSSLT